MSKTTRFSIKDKVQVTMDGGARWRNGVVVVVDNVDDNLPYLVRTSNNRVWVSADQIRARAPTAGRAPEPAAEADPTGKDQHQPGAKVDAGKILPALVLGEFARALEAVVRVGTKGARKYTPRGWLEVPNGQERYAEAAFRHQLEVWKGNRLDDGEGGTGELHKAQVIWNLLAELELELRNGAE